MFINLFSLLNVFYSYEKHFWGFFWEKIPEFFALLGEWGVFAEGIVIPQKNSRLTSAKKKKIDVKYFYDSGLMLFFESRCRNCGPVLYLCSRPFYF